MKFILAVFAIVSALLLPARADEKKPSPQEIEAFNRVMKTIGELQYQSGEISLVGGKAKIKLSEDFRFFDPVNARKVLVDVWNNPPEAGSVTGMIVPKGINFLDEKGWAAIIQWKDEGYVKDSGFDGTDFNKMLSQLKEVSTEASKERVRRGFSPMELTGWATAPHYDKQTHKLYWAKSYKVSGPDQQLNYDIRILGRSGFLELSILSAMSQLHDIEAKAPAILGMVDFTDGNRYADFKPGADNIAAYGIAGLIAGTSFDTSADEKERGSETNGMPFATGRSKKSDSHFPVTVGVVFLGLCLALSVLLYSSRLKSMPNNEKPPQPSGVAQNMPTFIAAIGMCGGFFMPWVTIGGVVGITGSTFAKLGEEGQASWLVLILAGVAAITHLAKPVRFLNVLAGVAPFGLLAYFANKMGSKLVENLAIGAWLILGCGLVLVFAPLKSASKD